METSVAIEAGRTSTDEKKTGKAERGKRMEIAATERKKLVDVPRR